MKDLKGFHDDNDLYIILVVQQKVFRLKKKEKEFKTAKENRLTLVEPLNLDGIWSGSDKSRERI